MPPHAISVLCHGTRGSVPSPGADTLRHGGNTPCVEIRAQGGRPLILDAGTGIIPLGHRLPRGPGAPPIELFLTHFHWDHIQGLPFFEPLRDADAVIRIHAEACDGSTTAELLAAQMRSPYFPVPFEAMPARIEFHPLPATPPTVGDLSIEAFPVRHPGPTFAFRIRDPRGTTVVYMPDVEPEHDAYPLPHTWERDVIEFVRGADLLLHDAMFTTPEYEDRRGWGHGTSEQALRLALAAGVRRLLLFHHHPRRTDAQLDAIVDDLRRESRAAGSRLRIDAAAEGRAIHLPAADPHP